MMYFCKAKNTTIAGNIVNNVDVRIKSHLLTNDPTKLAIANGRV
jgi:hypothetical protein